MTDEVKEEKLSDEELDEVSGGGQYIGYEDYWVKPGDTFLSIAGRYGIAVKDLGILNNIPYPYYIWVGQKLLVPKRRPY